MLSNEELLNYLGDKEILTETKSGRDRIFGPLLCTDSCGQTSLEKAS
jgi:predicted transcriptional regulator